MRRQANRNEKHGSCQKTKNCSCVLTKGKNFVKKNLCKNILLAIKNRFAKNTSMDLTQTREEFLVWCEKCSSKLCKNMFISGANQHEKLLTITLKLCEWSSSLVKERDSQKIYDENAKVQRNIFTKIFFLFSDKSWLLKN